MRGQLVLLKAVEFFLEVANEACSHGEQVRRTLKLGGIRCQEDSSYC